MCKFFNKKNHVLFSSTLETSELKTVAKAGQSRSDSSPACHAKIAEGGEKKLRNNSAACATLLANIKEILGECRGPFAV